MSTLKAVLVWLASIFLAIIVLATIALAVGASIGPVEIGLALALGTVIAVTYQYRQARHVSD